MSYQEILEAMRYYVDLGLPIIPLCPVGQAHNRTSPGHQKICKCEGKVPLIAGWQSRKETTEEHLEQWITQFKEMNIGLPLGEASGYCGIDIDGEEGEELLSAMSNGDLPETWEYSTGAGRRLLYRIPVGIPTKKFKQTGEGSHQECAILCTGQQTALPPSLHYTGKVYQWKALHSPYDIDCAMAPKWLIDLIKIDKQSTGISIKSSAGIQQYAANMIDIESEFKANEFDEYLPEELRNIKQKEVKMQSSKRDVEQTNTEKLLYQIIPEGSRDNTMTQIIGYFLSKAEYRKMPKDMFLQFMYTYNASYCDPPLEQEAIDTKVNYFWEIEAQKTAGYKSASKGKKEWKIDDVVNIVLNKLEEEGILIKHDQAKNAFYFCYKNIGPWVEDTETFVKSKMWQYLKDGSIGDESWGSQHKLNEAVEAVILELVARGYSRRQLFDMNVHREELSKYIVVDGKLLDWRTGEIYPWDPSYNATVNFKINYDANADCPHWKKYMEDWLPDESIRNLLQEFMGSCLLPEPAPEEKFIILTGHGSNGKSMFLKGMKNIFRDYSISLTPQKLAERFGPASLYGKLINICTEIEGDGGYIKNTAQLKAIVSGEALTAEYKGKDAFQFEPVTNLIFSCNTVPKSKDKTHGWYRRQLIIPFDREFEANSVISMEMERNMKEEIPGIFNWLLEGLRRIKSRGHFIVSDGLKQVQADFKAINDPMEGFIKDCLRSVPTEELQAQFNMKGANIGISTEIIRELYYAWCRYSYGDKDTSYRKSDRAFNQEMEARGFKKNRGMCVYRKSKTAIFYNIGIDLQNFELCNVIEDMYAGCSVTEAGFWLHDLAKKKRLEDDAK
jgi:P4 family phage/plasmid primase-like protien